MCGAVVLPGASGVGQDVLQVQRLIEQGEASASSLDDKAHTPLHWAALHDSRKAARLLISQGSPLDAVETDFRQTPLHWAVLKGHHNMVRMLIHAGASLDEEDSAGCTPVHYGAQYGQVLCTQILLMEGAACECLDAKGRTPLMWAAHLGHTCVARFLIQRGNALNAQDTEEKRTALHWAARGGHRLPALVLIKCGTDLTIQDKAGRTAEQLAMDENHPELAAEIHSYLSRRHRMQYLWNERGNRENMQVVAVVSTLGMSMPWFWLNVFSYTPYRLLLLIQMTLAGLAVYVGYRISQKKEVGVIVEPELQISGNPAAPANDQFFHSVTVDVTAKMPRPFRAAVAPDSGLLVRHFSHVCKPLGVHICGENYRHFALVCLLVLLDALLMVFVSVDVISSSPGSPSILRVHMWLWHNLTNWRYTLFTLWTCWFFVVLVTEGLRNSRLMSTPFSNLYMHEMANWIKLRYLQDGTGDQMVNPFSGKAPIENLINFAKGKLNPDHDMYFYSELPNVKQLGGQWTHPKDKRTL